MADFLDHLRLVLGGIEAEGLTKRERLITGAQGTHATVGGRRMLNFCANNYLGLAGLGSLCCRVSIRSFR